MSQGNNEIVAGAYCATGDLRIGDVRLPAYMGDTTSYVKAAADEIDAAIGHLYKTPVDLKVDGAVPLKSRPTQLTLKKINWLLASGRIVLELAQASESQTVHAYGMSMLNEGLAMLKQITEREMLLEGAPVVDVPEGETSEGDFTGPMIYNEDPESLVQSFYQRGPRLLGAPQASPYGLPQNRRTFPYGGVV